MLLNIYMVILLADKTELKEKTKKQQQKKNLWRLNWEKCQPFTVICFGLDGNSFSKDASLRAYLSSAFSCMLVG